MYGKRTWRLRLLSGPVIAQLLLCGLFLLGSAAGCFAAGLIRPDGGESLLGYLQGWAVSLREGGAGLRFLPVLWQTVRFPLAACALGLTAIGVVGMPVLFAARGFLMCYAVSAFYRVLGTAGLLPAFCLFGLPALLWLPALLHLGTQGFVSAYGLLRRAAGDSRYPLHMERSYFTGCGVCAAALCLCALAECYAIPIFLQAAVRFLPAG